MRFLLTTIMAVLLLPAAIVAQVYTGAGARAKISGADIVRTEQGNTNPTYIHFSEGNRPILKDLGVWLTKNLGLTANFGYTLISTENDQTGMVHYRYQQTFDGIALSGGIFIVHTKNSQIVSINGTIESTLSISNTSVLSEPEALQNALSAVNAKTYMWQSASDEKWIKQYKGSDKSTYFPEGKSEIFKYENGYRYIWRFDIYAKQPLLREDVIVDAQSGQILARYNKLYTTDVPGQAVTKYSGTRVITTDSTAPKQYRLRETGRGDGIQTWDMNTGTDYNAAVDFTDTNNFWNNINASQDEVAGDAHWSSEKTYDYFFSKFGRNSIDGQGFALLSYIHYDANFANAFWDGTRMTYGDGDGTMTAFTTLDICGHEITHGLTNFTANLVYADESGALSEGYSDIFGTAIEFYAKPPLQAGNWTEGEDIGVALRNIANPNATQNPDTYLGTYWDAGMEVHANSTVLSHWFYLTTLGGSGTNDIGNAFTVNGIGIDSAAAVAFRTLTIYLTPSSGYADARFYSIVSATDLFGGCTPEVEAVTNAWYAVGVGAAYSPVVTADFTSNFQIFCEAPDTVSFINHTVNGQSYSWTFGDGGSSTTTNPSHIYTSNGNYDVKLVADGGTCGKDSVTYNAFISIDPNNSNIASIPTTGAGATLKCCTGSLFDSGGETGDYSDNTDGHITIAPPGAATVTLTFTAFNFEAGYDYLYIYNGPSVNSPLIGQYDGTSLPNGGVIQSTGGSITLRQTTDQGVVRSGFKSTWQCNMPNAAPAANFVADITSSCIGLIQFTDQSTNAPNSWLWDFGDGSTSTLQNPLHAYTSSGTFTVSMTSGNSFGTDTETKNSYITINLPAAPAVTGGSVCDSGQVTMTATGTGQLDWYDAAIGGSLVFSGGTFVTPVIDTTTVYYVESKYANASVYGGKTNNNSGSGNYYGNQYNVHYEIFDAAIPFTLVSVKVYAQGAASRTILLRDASQTILQSLTVNIPDGESRVTLNFNVPAGTGLQLAGDGIPNLWRDNNGAATYPYTTAGIFSITQSSASIPPYNSLGNYYYFYDWEVQEPSCISARIADTALVYPCGSIIENGKITELSIYPNPVTDKINISYNAASIADAVIKINDVTGRTVYSEQFTTAPGSSVKTIDTQYLARGIYVLELKSSNGSIVRKFAKE